MRFRDWHGCELGNRAVAPAHCPCDGVQPCTMTAVARMGFPFVPSIPGSFFACLLLVESLQLQAGAKAAGAPAVFGVVGKHARVWLGKAGAAAWAGALDRKVLLLERSRGILDEPIQRQDNAHDPLAMFQCAAHGIAKRCLVIHVNCQVCNRQLDGVFFVPIQPGPGRDGDEGPIHTQVRMPLRGGPFGQVGVVALAVGHERCQHANVLACMLTQDSRHDLVRVLGLDTDLAARAHLCAELHVEEPQKVMDLGHGGDRGLAAASARTLLDGDSGWDAKNRVHIRLAGRLHDGARVGVQRLEIAPLSFVEQNVKRESGFA